MKKKTKAPSPIFQKQFATQVADLRIILLFFISWGLIIWGCFIYRSTFIHPRYLFATVSFGSVVAFATLSFVINNSYNLFWKFFQSLVIGGGLCYFSLLFINTSFLDCSKTTEDFTIIKTGQDYYKGGNNRPYATIYFHGLQKDIFFGSDYETTIKTYSKLRIGYAKGLLGFECILSKTLLTR